MAPSDKTMKLLPCPFCGANKAHRHIVRNGGFGVIKEGCIQCDGGGAKGPTLSSSWKDVADGWNKRASACTNCGHPLTDLGTLKQCPECGHQEEFSEKET